jgi:hypothetical protein
MLYGYSVVPPPQSPSQVHSPSTQTGVPQRQLKAPVHLLGSLKASAHVPQQLGGIEFVHATILQYSSALHPVVTGGFPRTVQR